MEKYIGYHFELANLPSAETIEAQTEMLIARLDALNFEGFEQSNHSLKAYIPESLHNGKAMSSLLHALKTENITFSCEEIAPQNWNSVWEENYEPVVIAGRVAVLAPHHNKISNIEHEITLEPKMSFGTGHHATTELAIRSMLEIDMNEATVLDMGSGTGILAILAGKLGAAHIDAIDQEEWAFKNCQENLEMNSANNINVILGTELAIPDKTYSVILANINKAALENMLPVLVGKTGTSGKLIIGGILINDKPQLVAQGTKLNLLVEFETEMNEWAGICFKKI